MSDAHVPQHLPDPFLRLKAGDVPCPAPVFVGPGHTVAQAARTMAQAGATAALVREALPQGGWGGPDSGGEILGILTERDVLVRVVAAGLDASTLPVKTVMTSGLITASPNELLIETFSRMVHHNIRRLVLLDESGAPVGLLGEGNMLAARGESPLALAGEIAAATDEAALRRCFQRLARLAGRSVAEGIGSEAVGRLISEMHDRIMSQAWGLALDRTVAERGPAPAPHALLVLGSQARREQYLATDQDLALVFDDGKTQDKAAGAEVAAWFESLGQRLTRLLLALGFPPCPKRIMLDNPAWRRSLNGWLDLADAMAERPDPEAVVTASLLIDLRPLPLPPGAGQTSGADSDLGLRLHQALTHRLSESSILLKCMAREAVRFSPPLGLFKSFSLKKDAEGRGTLDLKRGGVFPITQGAKVLALEHHLPDISTLERLRALKRLGALSATLAESLCEGVTLLQTLRMQNQAEALRQGAPPDNTLRPDDLGTLQRERLRGTFKLVAEFQDLLFEKYALRLLG